MATVKRHIFNGGGELIRVTEAGPQRIHVYDVSGLVASDTDDPLNEALEHPDVPKYGDPHGRIPGIAVVDVYGEHRGDDKTAARVTVTFAKPVGGTILNEQSISMTATTSIVDARVDVDGRQIRVRYYPDRAASASYVEQGGEVPVLKNHAIIEYRWSSGTPVPLIYMGKLNSARWNGGDIGTWACRHAAWVEVQGRYHNVFQAEYDDEYWPKAAVFRDANSGGNIPANVEPIAKTYVPTDTSFPNGWTRPSTYYLRDFGQLGFRQVYS